MSNQTLHKYVIYLKLEAEDTSLSFPYPPIYQDKQVDYLCFTSDKHVHSKFWTIHYVTNFHDSKISEILSTYVYSMEIFSNQILIGSPYQKDFEYNPILTIPKLQEIPDIFFDKEKLSPTKDTNGMYLFSKNPVYSDGPYHGRALLLTIGVPVSNQIDTIERCLSHIQPLLDQLPSELLVVNTGSTDGTIEICKKYGARIVDFPWCNNMSAARNTGIFHALGDWYLSIDDDEWFENVDEILSFFQTKIYLNYDSATYIQRNYHTSSGETWSDNHTVRMARITPELHFEGRIHDALIVPSKKRPHQIFSYAHHYGFIKNIPEKSKAKYIRNTTSLLYDIYEYPTSLRYNYQLAQELNAVENYSLSCAYFIRGISIEKEVSDPYYGKNHASHLFATLYNAGNKDLFPMIKLMEHFYPYTFSEKAFFAYIQADLGLQLNQDPKNILTFYQNYLYYKEQFEQDPNNSLLLSSVGLEVCTNMPYLIDAHVIAFCALLQKNQTKKAFTLLEKIDYPNIFMKKEAFIHCFIYASEEIYQACVNKLSSVTTELWSFPLLSELLESLKLKEQQNRQLKRLSYFLNQFSIDTLNRFFFRTKLVSEPEIQHILCNTALQLEIKDSSIQELFFYSFLLRCCFVSEIKEEKRMNLFLKYIQLTGAYADAYYQSELLKDTTHNVISRDILAAYYIDLALKNKDTISSAVSYLRTALDIFPGGFRDEIQKLLQEISQPKQDPVLDELTTLTVQIKKNAKKLIETGKVVEAIQILKELHEYIPTDKETIEMLEMLIE